MRNWHCTVRSQFVYLDFVLLMDLPRILRYPDFPLRGYMGVCVEVITGLPSSEQQYIHCLFWEALYGLQLGVSQFPY